MTGGFDPAMPNTARVYSRLLGGKDHFPSDRAEADLLLEIYPPLAEMVKENRAFIAEAVTWAATEGVGQFIDLGAGLPAPPAVHETAQAVLPGARVAYVDLDPMVLSHARALLADPGVAAVAADLRDPAAVLADHDLRAVINPAEPVCVILGAVLHFLDGERVQPALITAREHRARAARDHRPRDQATDIASGPVQHDPSGHTITEARSFAVQTDADCQRVHVQRLRRGHAAVLPVTLHVNRVALSSRWRCPATAPRRPVRESACCPRPGRTRRSTSRST